MTPSNDDTEVDGSASANPLAPLFERAARGAPIDGPGTASVQVTLLEDEWLLLSAADDALAEHGQWIASDGFLPLEDYR